jgi:hypothetical protein
MSKIEIFASYFAGGIFLMGIVACTRKNRRIVIATNTKTLARKLLTKLLVFKPIKIVVWDAFGKPEPPVGRGYTLPC